MTEIDVLNLVNGKFRCPCGEAPSAAFYFNEPIRSRGRAYPELQVRCFECRAHVYQGHDRVWLSDDDFLVLRVMAS